MSRDWDGWQRDVDLLELGMPAARCMIGENELPDRERVIVARAYRGQQAFRRQEFYSRYGKPLPWVLVAEQKERLGLVS